MNKINTFSEMIDHFMILIYSSNQMHKRWIFISIALFEKKDNACILRFFHASEAAVTL